MINGYRHRRDHQELVLRVPPPPPPPIQIEHLHLTRNCLKELHQDLFRSTFDPVEKVLRDSKIDEASIHGITLVGASCPSPTSFNGKRLSVPTKSSLTALPSRPLFFPATLRAWPCLKLIEYPLPRYIQARLGESPGSPPPMVPFGSGLHSASIS